MSKENHGGDPGFGCYELWEHLQRWLAVAFAIAL